MPVNSALKPAKPAKFNGSVRDLPNWLFAMNAFFDAAGVSDGFEKAHFAVMLLEGRALSWWRSVVNTNLLHQTPSWYDFVIELQKHFKDTDHEFQMRQRLASLKQTKSVDQYIERFREIITDMAGFAPD